MILLHLGTLEDLLPSSGAWFDLAQWSLLVFADHFGMKPPPEEPAPKKDEPPTKAARRIIEDYANALREIIKKVRKHLN
ncbi:hypothetical protein [Bradyrhizobium nanningense]|uniref:hypothetical protein n=1 Tax=Bradyrhizobium nanningense TaxID=1325118 RepID=UPI00100936F8|nr:hypothetical protein [Bradyrhizobium nanningense]